MKTKNPVVKEEKFFDVAVRVYIDCEKIKEWQDDYPDAQPAQKDVLALVREALEEYVNGIDGDGRGAGDGYCDDPKGPHWIASMLPKFEVK